MYYFIKWGDNTNIGWIGPYTTGEVITLSHNWPEGNYLLKAKVKDINDNESDWSTLDLSMSKNKEISYYSLLDFLEKYNYIFPLFRQILLQISFQ